MSLKDTLKKAASLIVEFDEEAPAPARSNTQQVELRSGGAAPPASDMDELDARLAAGRKAVEDLAAGRAPAAPGSPPPPTKTVEQIVRDTDGPNLDQISVASAPPPAPDGSINFQSIYQAANLPPAPFSAEQMLEMLASLPAELPLEMRRQTVKATLASLGKAIGASPETIVADTSRKLAALSAYVDDVTKKTGDFAAAANLEIAALEKQIQEKRQAIGTIQGRHAQVVQACTREADRLDDILEFLSLDVAPSKLAPEPPVQG
jgi:hypothetical protein